MQRREPLGVPPKKENNIFKSQAFIYKICQVGIKVEFEKL